MLTVPFLLTDADGFFTTLALANEMVALFPGVQFALTATLIFVLYILGAACVVFGDALFSIFPRMYLEREMETQAVVLRSDNSSLIQTLSGLNGKVDDLHAAVGLSILGSISILALTWGAFTWNKLNGFVFFALNAAIAIKRRVWTTYKYRIFVCLVLDVPGTDLNGPALERKPSDSRELRGVRP